MTELHRVNAEIGQAITPPPDPPYDPEVHDMLSETQYDALTAKKRRAFLLLVMDLKQRWTEYAEEAEHQDGIEYWDNFPTPEDAVEDFRLTERVLGDVE